MEVEVGDRRQAAAAGARIRSAGPGAGSPNRRTIATYAVWASPAVTFCSVTAGRSAGSSCPVRGSRRPAKRRCRSRISGCCGSSGLGSSSSPAKPGAASSAAAAPGPQASARIAPEAPSIRRRSVAGPASVRRASQAPSRPRRTVGSSPPWRNGARVSRRSMGPGAGKTAVRGVAAGPSGAGGLASGSPPVTGTGRIREASTHPRSCPRRGSDEPRERSPQAAARSCRAQAPQPWRSRRRWHGRCCA